MKKIKFIFKYGVIISVAYFVLTTLFLGYQESNYEKGVHNFYWSGLNALWKSNKAFGIKINEVITTKFDGLDGPYVFSDNVYFVNENNELIKRRLDSSKTIKVVVSNDKLNEFTVKIKDSLFLEKEIYEESQKLIAISDIEGNFDGFFSFLFHNNVIDQDANWTFGDGHLVLNGDFFDRGSQVTQVLWLIYHLENQAEKQGGKVHFIIGNHEFMNLYGYVKYNDAKYIHVAKQISKLGYWDESLKYLYSENSELGKWLRTKNIVEKIGNVIFVHGGLNKFHLEEKYSINELNTIAKQYYGVQQTNGNLLKERDRLVISGVDSPFWDRRLNLDFKHKMALRAEGIDAEPTTQRELNAILTYYKASKIVIGHSIVEDISADYEEKVIKIDVKHSNQYYSGNTKGILIENDTIFIVDDKRRKNILIN